MKYLAAAVAALSFAGCAGAPSASRSTAPLASEGPSGITGTVGVLTGDHMPPMPESDAPTPAAGAPVHVLRGAHAPMATIDRAGSDYVGTATTDQDGRFRVALPPGTYTVLTEHGGEPYLNCVDAGGWCTVTVSAGAWSDTTIVDSADATF